MDDVERNRFSRVQSAKRIQFKHRLAWYWVLRNYPNVTDQFVEEAFKKFPLSNKRSEARTEALTIAKEITNG
jgi:hypothetical protein